MTKTNSRTNRKLGNSIFIKEFEFIIKFHKKT